MTVFMCISGVLHDLLHVFIGLALVLFLCLLWVFEYDRKGCVKLIKEILHGSDVK